MYVTRPLSYYQQNPDALSLPPEGPNSGYLVVQDEESETYCCFGLCKNHDIMDLPFPQNKKLTVRYEAGDGENKIILKEDVMFITVLNKPLSSNHYYAIKPHGESKGQAFTCSKEEDKQNCCFCRCIRDVKPKPLDPEEVYQQYEISLYVTSCSGKGSFFAKSLAPDGFPPRFLRRKGWHLCAKTPKNYELSDDALGLNVELRKQLPEFNLTPFGKSFEAVVVGKWYCPFMFIKDGTVKEQMERSMFYEMTLGTEMGAVFHFVKMNTMKGIQYLWMGWQNQGRIKQVEQYRENSSEWRRLSCYVLVERFVLRRMDRSLVMNYDFKHIDKFKSIWE
ncbi:uncharacterized protein LOC107829121 [Nicotiana tabacum]|uniref:Uncharacterized protein LOC107829121 n=1 Tax=Nicotiana tabacum TaxID=4097 RepID=A0AC58U1T3_TOBAC